MTKKKASGPPYMKPPTKPMLQSLPPELLHNIFDWLDEKGVLAARRTCRVMAAVGLDHFDNEMPLVQHRDKFRALTEIAKHPGLAKRMKSLYYTCDRLDPPSYESWNRGRDLGVKHDDADDYLPEYVRGSERWMRAAQRAWKLDMAEREAKKAAVAASELDVAFKAYQAMYTDQQDMVAEEYDFQCLCDFFEGCPNLREVTVVAQGGSSRRLRALTTAFAEGKVTPHENFDCENTGVGQVFTLAKAVATTNAKLDSLTLVEITHRLFDEQQGDDHVMHMKALFRSLRRLRIATQYWPEDENEQNFELLASIAVQAQLVYRSGIFRSMLSVASNLRVLSLVFPKWMDEENNDEDQIIELSDALGDLTFPHLYEFNISEAIVTTDHLGQFLLRHKATLRRLGLAMLHLNGHDISWDPFFESIAGQLPQLRLVRLRGRFITPVPAFNLDFVIPCLDESKIMPCQDMVETFVLKGGEPPDWEALYEISGEITGRQEEDESWSPPDLPFDNFESDDPYLDYEMDEHDYRV